MTTNERKEACRSFIRENLIAIIREINYYHNRKILIAPVMSKAARIVDDDENPFGTAMTLAYEEAFAFFVHFHDQSALKQALQDLKEFRS